MELDSWCFTELRAHVIFDSSNGSSRCSNRGQHGGVRLRHEPARVGVGLRVVADLERVVVVGDAEPAVQEPEEPVGLVHQHSGRGGPAAAAAGGRVPPRHKLAEGGGGGAHGVVRRRDGLHGGQRVREALVVEERAGEELPCLAASSRNGEKTSIDGVGSFGCTTSKQSGREEMDRHLSTMSVVAEVPSMEMEEMDGR